MASSKDGAVMDHLHVAPCDLLHKSPPSETSGCEAVLASAEGERLKAMFDYNVSAYPDAATDSLIVRVWFDARTKRLGQSEAGAREVVAMIERMVKIED